MVFDPDEFLKNNESKFNPDKFIKENSSFDPDSFINKYMPPSQRGDDFERPEERSALSRGLEIAKNTPIESFKKLYKDIPETVKYTPELLKSGVTNLASGLSKIPRAAAETVGSATDWLKLKAGEFLYKNPEIQDALGIYKEPTGKDTLKPGEKQPVRDFFKDQQNFYDNATGNIMSSIPEELRNAKYEDHPLFKGVSFIAQNLPQYAGAAGLALTGNPELAVQMLSGIAGADQFTSTLDQTGNLKDALGAGISSYFMNMATEKAIPELAKDIMPGLKERIKQAFKVAGINATQEVIQGTADDIISQFAYDPSINPLEFERRIGDLIGGLGLGGTALLQKSNVAQQVIEENKQQENVPRENVQPETVIEEPVITPEKAKEQTIPTLSEDIDVQGQPTKPEVTQDVPGVKKDQRVIPEERIQESGSESIGTENIKEASEEKVELTPEQNEEILSTIRKFDDSYYVEDKESGEYYSEPFTDDAIQFESEKEAFEYAQQEKQQQKQWAEQERQILAEIENDIKSDYLNTAYKNEDGGISDLAPKDIKENAEDLQKFFKRYKIQFSKNKKLFESFEDNLLKNDFPSLKKKLSQIISDFSNSKSQYKNQLANQLKLLYNKLSSAKFNILESNGKLWEDYRRYYHGSKIKEKTKTIDKDSKPIYKGTSDRIGQIREQSSEAKKESISPTKFDKAMESGDKGGDLKKTIDEGTQEGGKRKVSTLGRKIGEKALENKLLDSLPELATYEVNNRKQRLKKVQKLIEEDYEKAKRIAFGEEESTDPEIWSEAAAIAVELVATEEGDVDTIKKLMTTASLEATRLGQRINMYAERNPNSPIAILKKIDKQAQNNPKYAQAQKRITELEKKMSELEKKLADIESKQSNKGVDELIKEAKKPRNRVADYGTKNRIIKKSEYEKIKSELNKRFRTNLNIGIDPQNLIDSIKIGVYHIEAGVRQFNEWSQAMIQDLGEAVKPYLQDIWDKAKEDHEKLFNESIEAYFKKGGDLRASDVRKVAKNFVADGIIERKELVKKTLDFFKKYKPELTEREMVDAIGEYGKFRKLSKKETDVKLREIKAELRKLSALEDLQKKGEYKKSGFERRKATAEEERLTKEINELKKRYGLNDGVVLKTLKTRLIKETSKLEQKLKDKDFSTPVRTPTALDKEAEKIKKNRDNLREAYNRAKEIAAKNSVSDEQIKKIMELSKKINDTATADIKDNKKWIDHGEAILEMDDYLSEIIPGRKSIAEEIIGLPRGLMTGGEFSFALIQGLPMATRLQYYTAFGSALGYALPKFGAKSFRKATAAIIGHPYYKLARKAGLRITRLSSNLAEREENLTSSFLDKVPVYAQTNRAYAGFLNKLRFDVFVKLIDDAKLRGEDVKQGSDAARDIAKIVNIFTLSGNVGKNDSLKNIVPILNNLLFSGRKFFAAVSMLNPKTYLSASPTARRAAIRHIVGLVSTTIILQALGKAFLGGDTEDEPTSPNYGKLIWGKDKNIVTELTGGNAKFVRLVAQLASGKKSYMGYSKKVDGGVYKQTRADLVIKFIRNQLAPVASLLVDAAYKTDFKGDDFTWSEGIKSRLYPMFLGDVFDLYRNAKDDMTAGTIFSALGAATNAYDSQEMTIMKHRFISGAIRESISDIKTSISDGGKPTLSVDERKKLYIDDIKAKIIDKKVADLKLIDKETSSERYNKLFNETKALIDDMESGAENKEFKSEIQKKINEVVKAFYKAKPFKEYKEMPEKYQKRLNDWKSDKLFAKDFLEVIQGKKRTFSEKELNVPVKQEEKSKLRESLIQKILNYKGNKNVT